MANNTTKSLINKTKKYLKERDLPFINVNNSHNLMVLKSSGDYHYLVIQFFEMPEKWMYKTRHFNIKTAYAIDYPQLTNAINRYLDANSK
jgi:hypothetical protein